MIQEPEVRFSCWQEWSESCRTELVKRCLPYSADLEWPGVYVWCWSEDPPQEPRDMTHPPEQVMYIGEAKKPLRGRVNGFAKGFYLGSTAHSGGQRCAGLVASRPGRLYLSYYSLVLESEPSDFWHDIHHWSRPFLHFVERTAIWRYVRLWGDIPPGNRT